MEEQRIIRGELFQALVYITLMCLNARERRRQQQ
jgi:hypothetical protein